LPAIILLFLPFNLVESPLAGIITNAFIIIYLLTIYML
jgi:hypothetical protein